MVGRRDRCWRTDDGRQKLFLHGGEREAGWQYEQSESRRSSYLAPDTPDWTSAVSGWCTYDPERLSSAVYSGTENLRTSSDARSLWRHCGRIKMWVPTFGSLRQFYAGYNRHEVVINVVEKIGWTSGGGSRVEHFRLKQLDMWAETLGQLTYRSNSWRCLFVPTPACNGLCRTTHS